MHTPIYWIQYMPRIVLKSNCLILLLVLATACQPPQPEADGKKRYVDSRSGDDGNDGLSPAAPWKTLKNVDAATLLPGDSIFFARGSSYSGGARIKASGSEGQPIVFTTYGEGSKPSFTNADYSDLNGNVFQISGSHIVIDGLYFHGTANYTSDVSSSDSRKQDEDKKTLLIGAVYQVTDASHLTVINAEFEDCPIGVYVNGKHNLINRNYFHDCNRFLWAPDWGPIAVVIGNAHNELSYNTCVNYVSTGGNYGADGGFIELDSRFYGGPLHHINIHHNYSEANQGFLEVTNSGRHLVISDNISDDYQQFIFFWSGDSSKIENNTVIRTRPPNASVNVVFTFKDGGFEVRNNIFVVGHGLEVFGSGAYDARNFNQLHESNVYFSADGTSPNPIGAKPGREEVVADPKFTDPKNKNYQPTAPAAQNKGASLPQSHYLPFIQGRQQ